MLRLSLFICLITCSQSLKALEVNGLSENETVKFIIDWNERFPDRKLHSIERREPHHLSPVLGLGPGCFGTPGPRPIDVRYNSKWVGENIYESEKVFVEPLDRVYTNELLIENLVSKATTELRTDRLGQYVGGTLLSGDFSGPDFKAVISLFKRTEIVTLHRTSTPLNTLGDYVNRIEKIEAGLCAIYFGSYYSEYKISFRYKDLGEETYDLKKLQRFNITKDPITELDRSSLDEFKSIIRDGSITDQVGLLWYITERFVEANPNAPKRHGSLDDIFAGFGGGNHQPAKVTHATSLQELESLFPLIVEELLPSTDTTPEGFPALMMLGMYADEALSAAQAAKRGQTFSRAKLRQNWDPENMASRVNYWKKRNNDGEDIFNTEDD